MVNSNLQTWRHNVLVVGALASELSCPGLSPGEQATLLSQCLSPPTCINGWSRNTPSHFMLLNLELFHKPYLTDCIVDPFASFVLFFKPKNNFRQTQLQFIGQAKLRIAK